jgi:uncharacterized protein YjbJ (UPF0337 family)
MSNLGSDPLKAKWQHQLEAAKQLWSKLTEDKLSGVNSDEKKLAVLVREPYDNSVEDVERQVKDFFTK